jgi:hypothetical protein
MIKKFYERYKVPDFHSWQEKYSPVIREEQVRNQWYPILDNSSDFDWPENTYAAHIAKKKNMKYVNLAVSGSGIDMVVTKFKQIKKNITPDDIIISDAPPVFDGAGLSLRYRIRTLIDRPLRSDLAAERNVVIG